MPLRTKLSRVAVLKSGQPVRSRIEHDPGGAVPLLQMKDLRGPQIRALPPDLPRIAATQGAARYGVQAGDILIRSRGLNTRVVHVDRELDGAVAVSPLVIIRAKNPDEVSTHYLAWYLNQSRAQAYLQSFLRGTSVQMIGKSALEQLEVEVPHMALQRQIVDLADLAEHEQQLLSRLAELKQRQLDHILWEAVTRSPRDHPASSGEGGGRGAATPLPPS